MMIYKATLIFSLLFLAVASAAQSDEGTYNSGQSQPDFNSSVTPTASQAYPSGSPMSNPPNAGESIPSQIYNHTTKPSHCQSYSTIPTLNASFKQSPSGIPSSMTSGASLVSKPMFTGISDCQSYSEAIIPTMTAHDQKMSGGAFPTANASLQSDSKPYYTITANGSYPQTGNSTDAQPGPSGPVQQDTAVPTMTPASYVGRRRFIRRQV